MMTTMAMMVVMMVVVMVIMVMMVDGDDDADDDDDDDGDDDGDDPVDRPDQFNSVQFSHMHVHDGLSDAPTGRGRRERRFRSRASGMPCGSAFSRFNASL